MKSIFKKALANKFIKNVSVLAGGTAVAQMLTVLILPILTRLYTPNDFEVFAMYTAVFSIFSVVVCLRFEIAIPIPEKDEDGLNLVFLSLLSICFTVSIFTIGIILLEDTINVWTDNKLGNFVWLLPVSLLLFGIFTAFQYWITRKKQFSKIAKARILQSMSASIAQLGCGALGVGSIGLVLGQIIQVSAGMISLGKSFFIDSKYIFHKISKSSLTRIFKKFDKFPKYSTWEALANSAAIQFPIIIVAAYSIGPEAGYIMLAMRILSMPMSLVGGAVAQVYLSEAADRHYRGSLRSFTNETIKLLFKVGFVPISLVASCAPFLIPIVFGDEWERTGQLISWMAPWFLLQFVVSPISMSLHITGNQKIAFCLQLLGFFFRVSIVYFAAMFYTKYIGEFYAVSGLVFYLIYLAIIYRVVKNH